MLLKLLIERLREINLDKLRTWKPLYKSRQQGGLAHQTISNFNVREIVKVGYEIYADGPTRVLRICEKSDCHKRDSVIKSSEKIRLRISNITVHLLERWRKVSLVLFLVHPFSSFHLPSSKFQIC